MMSIFWNFFGKLWLMWLMCVVFLYFLSHIHVIHRCSCVARGHVMAVATPLAEMQKKDLDSLHLTISHHISPYLTISHHISPYLTISHHISPYLTCHFSSIHTHIQFASSCLVLLGSVPWYDTDTFLDLQCTPFLIIFAIPLSSAGPWNTVAVAAELHCTLTALFKNFKSGSWASSRDWHGLMLVL